MMDQRPRLIVVDDEPDICEFVAEVADIVGYRCVALADARDFETELKSAPALVVLDLMMPGYDGVELLRAMARTGSRAGVVLMSGFDARVLNTAEELAKALGLSVVGRFQKPIRLAELEALFQRQLGAATLARAPRREGPAVQRQDLARALTRNEFLLHYQPQLDIASGAVIGAEGLVRWQHPEWGLIFPDAFIGLAEKFGLIDELGSHVAERGISEFAELTRGWGPITLSVNVSAQSLRDLEMPDRLAALAQKYGVPPSSLLLEITESGLVGELARALDILARLRLKGMQLSIDDFGTGYSMMEQLRRVPANEIKIDRSFVHAQDHDEGARVVVQKTIEIGQRLGMRVLAEGVETPGQLEFLRAHGCDAAQGYLFSRPLPLPEFVAWCAQRRAAA